MDRPFKIFYAGTLKPGTDRADFIDRFSQTFRLDRDRAKRLIESGKAVMLKKDLDRASAEQLRDQLEEMGMEVRVEPPIPKDSGLSLVPKEEELAESEAVSEATGKTVCPKCGSLRIENDRCLDCGIVLSKYQRIQERRKQLEENMVVEENPYTPPQAPLVEETEDREAMTGPHGLPIGQGWNWIANGFAYIKRDLLAWIGAFVVFVILSLLLQLVPLIGPLALQILTPILMGGLMLGARAQEQGDHFEVRHLFAGFSQHTGQLALVGLYYLLAMFLVGLLMAVLLGGVLADQMEQPMMQQDPALAMQGMADPTMVLLAALIGLALAIPLSMAYFFAPALVAIEGLSALSAMKYSFLGCLKNILPFLWYGLIGFLLLILAILPLGLGLLIVGPLIFASIYVAFREIYYG